MSHYKSNLRDIEFNLFEALRRQDLLATAQHRARGAYSRQCVPCLNLTSSKVSQLRRER